MADTPPARPAALGTRCSQAATGLTRTAGDAQPRGPLPGRTAALELRGSWRLREEAGSGACIWASGEQTVHRLGVGLVGTERPEPGWGSPEARGRGSVSEAVWPERPAGLSRPHAVLARGPPVQAHSVAGAPVPLEQPPQLLLHRAGRPLARHQPHARRAAEVVFRPVGGAWGAGRCWCPASWTPPPPPPGPAVGT